MHMPDDTIAAISTPIGEGGIGIVRLSGPEAVAIAEKVFVSRKGTRLASCASHTVRYGHIARPGDGPGIVDEVLVTVMRAPRTYTREDIVEINCHGGIRPTKAVLDRVLACGARLAEPGEFTRRAFLNGRIDLAQAEAVIDVIRSKTDASLKVALSQLDGGLSREVASVRDALVDIAASLEATIDFPEEEAVDAVAGADLIRRAGAAIERLERLADSYGEGLVLREGVLAIICGKPNVGKSSLMNLLLKRDRVIVSPVPGTTRDTVEETIALSGVPIRLVDTAGIGRGRDALEREGVRRSKKYAQMADIALVVLDATTGAGEEDRRVLRLLAGKKKLVIVNKIDAGKKLTPSRAAKLSPGDPVIGISVEKRKNIPRLERAICELVWGGEYAQGEGAVVSNARHKALLDKALGHVVSVRKLLEEDTPPEIVSVELREAIRDLGLMTGHDVSGDILDRIFQQFCIGK